MLLLGLALLLSESNAENSQKVTFGGLHVDMSFDQSLPLFHHRAKLVSGEVHAVELGQTVLALNVFAHKLELFVRPLGVLIVMKCVSKGKK